jgi:hypothetical protein
MLPGGSVDKMVGLIDFFCGQRRKDRGRCPFENEKIMVFILRLDRREKVTKDESSLKKEEITGCSDGRRETQQ